MEHAIGELTRMLSKLTSYRPAHATVVAYLALFVALGGSSYAAIRINGKSIKNRTIAGKKLKNDTLTGTQVNESQLGQVPLSAQADRAARADRASGTDLADRAKTADTATSADHAASADSAALADNAQLLAGREVYDFLLTSRVDYGDSNYTTVSASSETLLSWPEGDLQVRDDSDGDKTVVVRNTSANRTLKIIRSDTSTVTTVAAGATSAEIPATNNMLDFWVGGAASNRWTRAMCYFDPTAGVTRVHCFGINTIAA